MRDTGVFFEALTEHDQQLAELITNSNRVFGTTAERDREIRETFIALPTFIDESKKTLRRLESYAANTDPLVTELHPWARAASDTLQSVRGLAPDFNRFMQSLGPLVDGFADAACPPGRSSSTTCGRCSASSIPFLRNFNPFLR